MSNRTLLEVNHDFGHRFEREDGELVIGLFSNAIRSGDDKDWAKLEYFGIRKIVMRHHSDDAIIKLPYATIKL